MVSVSIMSKALQHTRRRRLKFSRILALYSLFSFIHLNSAWFCVFLCRVIVEFESFLDNA